MRGNARADRLRSMEYLRRLAKEVWDGEAPSRRFPDIVAGRGIKYGGTLLSYCLGYTRVVLARNQRSILVLLHELTHALGPVNHGAKFVKLYFRLLEKYAKYDWRLLQGVAAERGIVL